MVRGRGQVANGFMVTLLVTRLFLAFGRELFPIGRVMKPWLLFLLALTSVASAVESKGMVAARSAYEKADKELNKTYAEARSTLDKGTMDKLREDQRKWLDYRDYIAERSTMLGNSNRTEADIRDTKEFWTIRGEMTKARIEHVRAWIGKGVPEGITGYYCDGAGGTAMLIVENGKLLFSLECVRGPTAHLGDLSGSTALQGQAADFSDGAKEEDGGPATLHFAFTGKQFDLEGKNTGAYHGARAYFDGHYVKYRALTQKEAQEMHAAPKEK